MSPSTDCYDPPAAQQLRARLVADLTATGTLRHPGWVLAFTAVPRHRFVPVYHQRTAGGDLAPVTAADPEWLAGVYQDRSLVTGYDPADPTMATSSSTAPTVMATMLEALDATPGHRVLEIGTGTGYNAAVLAHRLGATSITSVDIDPALVEQARAALTAGGDTPTLACADGADGYPPAAPYDRIIATCAVDRIPPAWLAQLYPGGVIVANLGFLLAQLEADDSRGVRGRFLPQLAAFMELRPGPGPATTMPFQEMVALVQHDAATGTAAVPARVDDDQLAAIVHLAMPGIIRFRLEREVLSRCLVDPYTRSWARLDTTGTNPGRLTQHGPRQLWTELEQVHQQWTDAGQPGPDRLGLTVTTTGDHTLWADNPRNRLMAL